MPCNKPRDAWRSTEVNPSGKRSLVFCERHGDPDAKLKVPCGDCRGCRLNYARNWMIRIQHEASLHERNCVITLTYDPENLPEYGSLHLPDFQDFMKRLRERILYDDYKAYKDSLAPDSPVAGLSYKDYKKLVPKEKRTRIRFFHCGEYGAKKGRPHYHAVIFGYDFPDKLRDASIDSSEQFKSEMLSDVWGKGRCTVGKLNVHSASYIARYITKKQYGRRNDHHYEIIDLETSEIVELRREYVTMSRNPGIARRWFDQFKKDVYPNDFVVVNGRKYPPPKIYDYYLELEDPEEISTIKAERQQRAAARAKDNTPARLAVKERLLESKLRSLKRSYEDGT